MTCTFTSIAESIAADAKRLEDDAKKANAHADFLQRELSRVCVERDGQRGRANAAELERERLRAEVARLTVAKLPTAADYDRLVKERDALDKACEIFRGEVLRWEGRALSAESERDAHARDAARLLTHADNMYMEDKKIQAEYADLKAHVEAAFNTLGKREDESFEGCAARIMSGYEETIRSLTACRAFREINRGQAERYAEEAAALKDKLDVVSKERDDFRDRWLGENGRIFDVLEQRDAARAELARVREALGTLVSEGRKGGGS